MGWVWLWLTWSLSSFVLCPGLWCSLVILWLFLPFGGRLSALWKV